MPRKRKRVKDLTREEFLRRYLWPKATALLRYWPPAQEAMKRAKVGKADVFLCGHCQKVKREKEMQRDHRQAMGFKNGVSWDERLERLFCGAENFQILCVTCHQKKTKSEAATSRRAQTLGATSAAS